MPSSGLTAEALMRTKTWSAPGVGSGRFASLRTSGPPCDAIWIAFMVWVRRAADFRGSSRFLGRLPFRAESRIPAPEGVLSLLVEVPGPYLKEQMRPPLPAAH